MDAEIRKLIMEDFERARPEIEKRLEKATVIGQRLDIPFMDRAGVICTAVYECMPVRIIAIRVPMAKTGIVSAKWLHPTTVYCDEIVDEIINLDSERDP